MEAPPNTSANVNGKCLKFRLPLNWSSWPALTTVVYSHEMALSVLELTVMVVISMNGLQGAAQDFPPPTVLRRFPFFFLQKNTWECWPFAPPYRMGIRRGESSRLQEFNEGKRWMSLPLCHLFFFLNTFVTNTFLTGNTLKTAIFGYMTPCDLVKLPLCQIKFCAIDDVLASGVTVSWF